jgi:hypothetical protein
VFTSKSGRLGKKSQLTESGEKDREGYDSLRKSTVCSIATFFCKLVFIYLFIYLFNSFLSILFHIFYFEVKGFKCLFIFVFFLFYCIPLHVVSQCEDRTRDKVLPEMKSSASNSPVMTSKRHRSGRTMSVGYVCLHSLVLLSCLFVLIFISSYFSVFAFYNALLFLFSYFVYFLCLFWFQSFSFHFFSAYR